MRTEISVFVLYNHVALLIVGMGQRRIIVFGWVTRLEGLFSSNPWGDKLHIILRHVHVCSSVPLFPDNSSLKVDLISIPVQMYTGFPVVQIKDNWKLIIIFAQTVNLEVSTKQ